MNSRRTIILIAAVAAGAFAALGLLSYVRSVENNAGDAAASREIWVVTAPIPKGTPAETVIEQQLIGKQVVAENLVATTTIVDPATELAGLVAIADLDVNLPLVSGFFASPAVVKTGVSDRLEERGLVTVSFTVDQARGAAYLIEPGDRVNVLVERPWDTTFFDQDPPVDLTDGSRQELAGVLAATDTVRPVLSDAYPVNVRYVYQNAEVLAVGNSLVPGLGDTPSPEAEQAAIDRGLITLAVPPEAAQTILAVGRENIYLSLVPIDYVPRAIQPEDPTRQVLPGELEGSLTPYEEAESAGLLTELPFSDGESRIGDFPSGTTPEAESQTVYAESDTSVPETTVTTEATTETSTGQ